MPERLRFAADEHIDVAVVKDLRRRGIDIVSFQEAGRRGLADIEQLDWATASGRVVVTHDDDFLVIAASARQHGGIAFCSTRKHDAGGLVRALLALGQGAPAGEMINRIHFL